MDRKFYIDLANSGLKMPIGADMLLRTRPDHEEIQLDGRRLGEVIVETAHRFKTPLAFPLMDLTLEKEWILKTMGVEDSIIPTYHFPEPPSRDKLERALSAMSSAKEPQTQKMKAGCGAISHVAASGLLPVGMCIGPFSMMTKLLPDPITAVFMAGSGMLTEGDPEAKMLDAAMSLSMAVVMKSIEFQAKAGAKAVCLCEPAANKVYISPRQIEEGSDVFEKYVLAPNRRIRELLKSLDTDLIFHDCGELTDGMVSKYNELDPAILSLGSSRVLWEDARLVSKDIVLFGNLPSKKFYSDKDITLAQVKEMSKALKDNMKIAGHPFILGSECDVLSVPGSSQTIMEKVEAMLSVA